MSDKPLLYSYIRFSTIEQANGQSLNRQMTYAKDVAMRKGLELDDSLTMRDLGLSAYDGTNVKKGALGVFLAAVEQGRVRAGSILVIESLDRISRGTVTECNSIVTQIINAGITVITAMDNKEYNKQVIDKNPFELFAMLMIFIRANEESETKSLRVRAALIQQCNDWLDGKRGFYIKCGKAPSWVKWNANAKVFEFEPREKAIMLRKVELYKQGLGGIKIAEILNSEFGRGTAHHTGANVYKEVKRRTLIGEFTAKVGDKDYTLEDYYPRLLSDFEFNSLIADSAKRGAIKYSQKFVGILGGIDVFKCGCCGKSVNSHVIYRQKLIDDVTAGHKRYGCVEARRNNKCTMNSTIQLDLIENAVVRFCQDKVNLKRILLNDSDRETIAAAEDELKLRLEKIDKNINVLMDTLLMLDGEPPQAIANKIKVLETEAAEIQEMLKANKNKIVKMDNTFRDVVTDRWLSLTNNLSELGNDKRMELRQLVKDTFKTITLQIGADIRQESSGLDHLLDSHFGIIPNQSYFDLTLEFHNEKKRLLRLDKKTGALLAGFDLR